MDSNEKSWTKEIKDALVGRKIKKVEYLPQEEADKWGWHFRPLCIQLDDGTWLIPSSDDEGNNGGALHTNLENLSIIPVM